jgi:Flp pilus assembly protein TadB
MNKTYFVSILSLAFYSQHVIKHCSTSLRREQREIEEKNSVRCLLVHLLISLLHFYTKSLAHAAAVIAVVMVGGATAARWLLLCLHHRHRLQPCHTIECWSGPRPLPLISR